MLQSESRRDDIFIDEWAIIKFVNSEGVVLENLNWQIHLQMSFLGSSIEIVIINLL
jgi:hypothetical protein